MSNSKRPDAYNAAKAFQGKVSGHPDLSFELNGISFDAIVDGKLVDAKFGYGASTCEDVYDEELEQIIPEIINARGKSKPMNTKSIVEPPLAVERKVFYRMRWLFRRPQR